eukprot:14207823-Alexandrium_andersonii.AAC.1
MSVLLGSVEQVNVDAAAGEQLAAQVLKGAEEATVREAHVAMVNIKIVSRGRARASRRIIKRPWMADEDVK